MINGVKRGFGYTFGKYLLLFLVAIVVGLVAHFFKIDLRSVFIARVYAVEIDNSIIATQWNKFYKNSTSNPSTSTNFYANKTFIWSEQYSKFNWYFWETTYNLTDRLELFKDFITSRSYTNISNTNDIKFVIVCSANFNNSQIHNSTTLLSGGCSIVPFVNGANSITITESIPRINGSLSDSVTNSTYIDTYNLYAISIPSNNSNIFIEFTRSSNSSSYYNYFRFTDDFFTIPLEDLDSHLSSLSIKENKSTSLNMNLVNSVLSTNRIYYNSVPNINGTLNTYYPWDRFVYQSDLPISFDTSIHSYYSLSNESISEQYCHIINDSNTCDSNFVFKSYLDYLNDDGEVNQDKDGNVDVSTDTQVEKDYSSNINSINSNIIDSNIDTPDDITSWLDSDESQFLPSNFINTINTFINGLSSQSCIPLQTSLLGESYTLPCISSIIWVHIPTLELVYQTIMSGLIIYYLILYNLKTINNTLDPLYDKIEVIKL